MGRKKVEDKRISFCRMVAGGTPALVKNLSQRLGMSEGKVLDEAVHRLDVTEVMYEKVSGADVFKRECVQELPPDLEPAAPKKKVAPKIVAEPVVGSLAKPKFVPPKNIRFQRKAE